MKITFRKIVYLVLFFAFTAATLVILLYKQVNLDDYRHHLEEQLSVSLRQPVTIGQGKLTFRNGLALDLHDLRIGATEAPIAEIPRLTGTLKIAPLLDGKIILDQILVDNPTFRVQLPFTDRPARGTTHKLFDALGIRILTVRNASLYLEKHQAAGVEKLLKIDDFNAVLKGWEAASSAQLVVSGQVAQPTKPANFILEFNLPAISGDEVWRLEPVNYHLTLRDLSTGLLGKPTGGSFPAAINIDVDLQGVPGQGANFRGEVRGSDRSELLAEIGGLWSSTAEQESFSQINGTLLGLPIGGEILLLRRATENLLAGRLGTEGLNLSPKILNRWKVLGIDELLGGQVAQLSLMLEKSWPPNTSLSELPRFDLFLALRDLTWKRPELRHFTQASLQLSFEKQRLRVTNGRLAANGHQFLVSGQVNTIPSDPQLDLEIKVDPDLASLTEQYKLPAGWLLDGRLPVQLHLSGPLRQPDFLLNAQLNDSRLELGRLLHKSEQTSGSVQIAGLLTKNQLLLTALRLQLGELALNGKGSLSLQGKSRTSHIALDPFELAPLQELSPILTRFQLHGKIKPSIELQDGSLRGTLGLSEVGCHLFHIVGDPNHLSGQIQLSDQGLTFSGLSGRLGESELILAGSLRTKPEPELSLSVKGKEVRAVDLIFPNQELTFHDLDGRLRINAQGIVFDPVRVRLEENTRATVTGRVDNFKDPQTILDITSSEADILQVIDLFQGEGKPNRKPSGKVHRPTLIKVKAEKGSLGGLQFLNAEGSIKDDQGVFTLYPLRFQTGEGDCLARIEFDRQAPERLLKISGHANNVDATILHQNIFKERGLIKGRLKGDFYLQGAPGASQFWGSARGGAHLLVNDGTLRKFSGLAKVFSILNISQLFSFQLPDIDKDGMPFSLLEGSLKFANGWVKTEDLHIVSEAMNLSLVGKQSLVEDNIDYHLGVMPLRTVDKLVTAIPIAGWILAGEDKAIFTAQFKLEGSSRSPSVMAVPVESVSDTVFGIFKRTLGLPGKLVKDVETLFKDKPKKK